ncbi:MAG: hypothetical protein AAF202_02065, partial [Pseudomonadota bacterium]
QSGHISHGVHLSDLLLLEAEDKGSSLAALDLFEAHTSGLAAEINSGAVKNLNEKIDGSPSIIAGFHEGRPFVAYKTQVNLKRGPQKLLFDQRAWIVSTLLMMRKRLPSMRCSLHS